MAKSGNNSRVKLQCLTKYDKYYCDGLYKWNEWDGLSSEGNEWDVLWSERNQDEM